jgi:hypothetical protein
MAEGVIGLQRARILLDTGGIITRGGMAIGSNQIENLTSHVFIDSVGLV